MIVHTVIYNTVVQYTMKEREMYEGIICRFIINLPRQQLEDPNRLGYHLQKAFYHYMDEVLKEKPSRDWQKQRNDFLFKIKEYCPSSLKINPQLLLVKLQDNKPVCGAIIFNRDLTKVMVIKVKDKYGFPKGKWNQNQDPQNCAAREVYEQTGICINDKIDSRIRIEFQTHGSTTYFFIAKGVSQVERMKIDHKEIDDIVWMRIEEVRKCINLFVERSRIAWNIYEKEHYKRDCQERASSRFWKKDSQNFDYSLNPILQFKFDRNRIYDSIFASLR